MNIFILAKDVDICAAYHCDKHVVKMTVEYAQLLCGAVILSGGEAPYKLTHANHPCAIWARESMDQWVWLRMLALNLCNEYTERYDRVHKCEDIIRYIDFPKIPSRGLNFSVQAMPDIYKHEDVVEAYRRYYIGDKSRFAKWKQGNVPYWFV